MNRQHFSLFNDPVTGTSLKYPTDAALGQLSDQDNKDKIIFRATDDGSQPYKITLKYESGLRALSTLTKQTAFDMVYNNAQRALPQAYPGYSQSATQTGVNKQGNKTGEILFEYDGSDGERLKQRFEVVMKDDDTAFYLAQQAKSSQYNELNNNIFDQVYNSIKFN